MRGSSRNVARARHATAPLRGHPVRVPVERAPTANGNLADVTRTTPRIRTALAALVMTLGLAACTDTLSGLDAGGGEGLASPIPPLQPADEPITVDNRRFQTAETRLGASQHPQILATYGGLYADPKVERTVAGIVGRLTEASPRSTETYRVFLLDSGSVNAFALPGGYLYVTRGLLALADDSAELAAVLAHEMAHVIADHGIERQRRVERTELAQRVAGQVMGERAAKRAVARDEIDAARFSREQELEADKIGIRMMADAGFDPRAAVDFLRSMERYTAYRTAGRGEAGLDFLATHPAAPQRLKALGTLANALAAKGGDRERARYLKGIDGLVYGDASDQGFVRGRSFAHPKLGIGFEVPEGYTLENGPDSVVATGPGDIAVRFDMVNAEGAEPEDYLRSGWVAGLSEPTVERTEVAGFPAARGRAFAGGYAFDVTVLRVDNRFYRFLTAAPPTLGNLREQAAAVAGSFRRLPDTERSGLKPLRVVIRDRAGPEAMRGVERPAALYKVLNSGGAANRSKVKIVTDG